MLDERNPRFRMRGAAALFTLALFGSACAGGELAQPDSVLVNKANTFYAKKRFSQATDVYRQSIEENPDSPHRRAALLGLADSLYKDKNYFEAILYYERFIELYPLDPLKPRALFYLGMSYYHDAHTPDRDQTPAKKAIESFDLFLQENPGHILAPLAREFKVEMMSNISGSLLEVARFYHRTNKNQAAIGRLKEYLDLYPGAPDAPEAMYLLADCYYREQSYKNAAITLADLIKKHPGDEFAARGGRLANKLKLKDE